MPYPQNLEFAAEVEKIIRAEGAVPATMAIIDGRMKVGLSAGELELMCKGEGVVKVSRRDPADHSGRGRHRRHHRGFHHDSGQLWRASACFATGGIGGVHRGAETTMDISADLQELRPHQLWRWCARAPKMILDIGLTLEYLETMGVPVLGLQTRQTSRRSTAARAGFGVDYAARDAADVAQHRQRRSGTLGLAGGMLVGNPVPEEFAMDFDRDERRHRNKASGQRTCRTACKRQGHITPYLLAHIVECTQGGDSLATNIQLAYNNARAAAKIAACYAKL